MHWDWTFEDAKQSMAHEVTIVPQMTMVKAMITMITMMTRITTMMTLRITNVKLEGDVACRPSSLLRQPHLVPGAPQRDKTGAKLLHISQVPQLP